jgi:hypothetical protein
MHSSNEELSKNIDSRRDPTIHDDLRMKSARRRRHGSAGSIRSVVGGKHDNIVIV